MFDMKCVFLLSLHLGSELFSHSSKNSSINIVNMLSRHIKCLMLLSHFNQI